MQADAWMAESARKQASKNTCFNKVSVVRTYCGSCAVFEDTDDKDEMAAQGGHGANMQLPQCTDDRMPKTQQVHVIVVLKDKARYMKARHCEGRQDDGTTFDPTRSSPAGMMSERALMRPLRTRHAKSLHVHATRASSRADKCDRTNSLTDSCKRSHRHGLSGSESGPLLLPAAAVAPSAAGAACSMPDDSSMRACHVDCVMVCLVENNFACVWNCGCAIAWDVCVLQHIKPHRQRTVA